MPSTVPAVITAVSNWVTVNMPDVLFSVGLPTVDLTGAGKIITIGGQDDPTIDDGETIWSQIGRNGRRESYTLTLYIVSVRGDSNQLAGVIDVFDMRDTLDAFMRTDPSLGLAAVDDAAVGTTFTLDLHGPATQFEGRWTQLTTTVGVRARI